MTRPIFALLLAAYIACAVYAIVTLQRDELMERAVTWTGGVLFIVLGWQMLTWLRERRAQ